MAVDLRLGQFISDCVLQPQRTGAAGGGVPGVLESDHRELPVDLLEAPRHTAGVEGSGDAAGVSELNTVVPVLEAVTGVRRALAPPGCLELRQAAEGNHGSACGFTLGFPVAAGR